MPMLWVPVRGGMALISESLQDLVSLDNLVRQEEEGKGLKLHNKENDGSTASTIETQFGEFASASELEAKQHQMSMKVQESIKAVCK